MSNVIFLLKLLVAVLPILLMCLWDIRSNLKKEIRSRQFLMTPVALVYGVVTSIFFSNIYSALTSLVKLIPNLCSMISEDFGKMVSNFINSFNLNFWMVFVSNIIIMFVFVILKKALCAIFKRVFANNQNRLHAFCVKPFYEYDADNDCWCVKTKFGQMRTFFKSFYAVVIALSVIMFLACMWIMLTGAIKSPFYPAFVLILIGEIVFFLDGFIKPEYRQNVLGEDEDTSNVVNYSLMRKVLRALFPDKLSAENTVINNPIASIVTNDEVINNLLLSDDENDIVLGTFVRKLADNGIKIDQNYVYSTAEMLKGKSILFNTPFYNDLIPYVFFPMQKVLMKHKKVLIVLGRHGIENEIADWFSRGIAAVTNIEGLWNTGVLNNDISDYDVGILTRSAVHDIGLHHANADFFKQVGFVMLIEPSKLLSTAQIGLNSVVKACCNDNDRISFCSCDKNCDGLLDALSHALMTQIVEVSATNKQDGMASYMCWDADDDFLQHRLLPNISRYMGIGTELSFVALKNQISKTYWYGGETYPVVDQNWINRQYYYDLLKYAGLPTKQEELENVFIVSPLFWNAETAENLYITVEDESNNLFEMVRDFSTRASEQGFINVISQDYLLKDYMTENLSLFETDAKAIPYIVADYARTDRNVIMRLMLMMSSSYVKKEDIIKEFSLVGKKAVDIKKILWYEICKCYLSVNDEISIDEVSSLTVDGYDWNVICCREKFNIDSGRIETLYYIEDENFIAEKVGALKNATYISEDEKGNRYYLGAELLGHIFQKYLPGQFFTFSGKYYEMIGITADNQVIMRRAADHINGRDVTRQIRNYSISAVKACEEMGSRRNIDGIEVSYEYADYEVSTDSYLRMKKYGDFKTAKKVEINGIPDRKYTNKKVLKISFPEISARVRATMTFMFNEIFRTLFAENQPYITALTDISEFSDEFVPITNSLSLGFVPDNVNCIYIVEDSRLDLGLVQAVDRNLKRIFEIMCDWINWHKEALEISINPPAEDEPMFEIEPQEENSETEEPPKKKKGIFRRIWEKIKSIFKRKKKKQTEPDEEQTETDEENGLSSVISNQTENSDVPVDDNSDKETSPQDNESEDAQEEEITFEGEDEVAHSPEENSEESLCRQPYYKRHYLLFGGIESPVISIDETVEFLQANDFGNNSLEQARKGIDFAEELAGKYRPDKEESHFCDFCGVELVGTEYEVLSDGRERCMMCGRTAVKTTEEFISIFRTALRNLEAFFGIRINTSIKVKMVNAGELAKNAKSSFIPTKGFDARAVGVAIKDSSGYTICIENGTPRISAMLTIVHELTHIWQYLNWNDSSLAGIYGKDKLLEIYEGMAKWVEIQYAYLINEKEIAIREEISTSLRNDEYGRGFLMYRNKYSFSKGTFITKATPFTNREMPL